MIMHTVTRRTLKALILIGLFIPLAFVLRDSRDDLQPARYNAAAPTTEKYAQMARWIPTPYEFMVALDPQRVFGASALGARLAPLIEQMGTTGDIDVSLVARLIARPQAIGLIALALYVGENARPVEGLVVVQGDFRAGALHNEVRAALAKDNPALKVERLRGVEIYMESAQEEGFAFAFPDAHHLMVGSAATVVRAVRGAVRDAAEVAWAEEASRDGIFGRLLITGRIARLLPKELAGVAGVSLSSRDGASMVARIPCLSVSQAENMRMFLEGLYVAKLLIYNDTSFWGRYIQHLDITQDNDTVLVTLPLGAP